jgi:hypothetical protein
MKNLAATLCRSPRTGQFAASVALGSALAVSNGTAVGVSVGLASLVAFGLFGRR